uniref:Uncharacterized protein n=1 Tax=Setaria italica TaxID=4555 RepID=K3YDL8_SETIT
MIGERKEPLIRSLDYRCVRQFCLRRLFAFLWLSKEMTVFFRVEHLQHVVRLGMWSGAMNYVFGFVPVFYRYLNKITAYRPTNPSTFAAFDPYSRHEVRCQGGVNPDGIKLAQIIRSVCSKEAWLKAAEVIVDLVA